MSNDKRLGEMLVEDGLISQFQLDAAISDQRSWGGNLGRCLVRMGAVSRNDLADFMARRLNLERVDFRKLTVEEDAIKLLSREICWKYKIVPIMAKVKATKKGLLLAMADPSDIEAIQDVEFRTNYRVTPVVADEEEIEKVIDFCYAELGFRQCKNGECLDDLIHLKPDAIDMGEDEQIVIMTGQGEEKVIQRDDRMVGFRALRALVDLLIDKGFITQEEFRKKLGETQ